MVAYIVSFDGQRYGWYAKRQVTIGNLPCGTRHRVAVKAYDQSGKISKDARSPANAAVWVIW